MVEQRSDTFKESYSESTEFDYDNSGWPRDFDIRIEVAEQKEVFEYPES